MSEHQSLLNIIWKDSPQKCLIVKDKEKNLIRLRAILEDVCMIMYTLEGFLWTTAEQNYSKRKLNNYTNNHREPYRLICIMTREG